MAVPFGGYSAQVAGTLGFRAAAARLGGYGAANHSPYRSSGLDTQDTVAWWPSRSSADGTVLPAKDLTLARVRDVVRNDANARAAVERLVDLVVGPGFTLASIPDGRALGIEDTKVLRELARDIQTEFRLFARDPRRFVDVQRKLSLDGLFRLFARTWVLGGETSYAIMWRDPKAGESRRYATCVMAVDPDRLSNPDGQPETSTLRGGVEMDSDGAPIAYHVRNAHIGDYWAGSETCSWTRVPRATKFGRPIFVHGFEPEREGQTRAISPFASLITRLRMIGKFGDTELAAAALNALNVAFVESALPPEEVATRLTPQAVTNADRVVDHFTKHPARFGGVRIPVLPPGSTIKMNASPRQTSSFAAFQTAFLQSIASALGLSYEQLSMDWSRTNYSSARAALNEVWRSIERMRSVFVEQVVMPLYYAFLEEAIDKGYVRLPASARPRMGSVPNGADMNGADMAPATAPDLDDLDVFHAMPAALLRSIWIGPARGIIDPLKEAEATVLELEGLTTTLRQKCAERGLDYEEVLDQIEIENQDLKDRELTRMSLVAAVQANKGAKPDSEEAEGPAGPGGDATGKGAARSRMEARLASGAAFKDADK